MLSVMLCPKCGKESHNLRVCAFCQTPYPLDRSAQGGASRGGRATASARGSSGLGPAIARVARLKRWGAIGLLAVFTAGYWFVIRERTIPVGVVVPNLITVPMTPASAAAHLKEVENASKVELRNGELTVQISAALFPQRRDGQLALAQQYARADEIVQGRKRAISFLDPTGSRFAKADPDKGVMMTR